MIVIAVIAALSVTNISSFSAEEEKTDASVKIKWEKYYKEHKNDIIVKYKDGNKAADVKQRVKEKLKLKNFKSKEKIRSAASDSNNDIEVIQLDDSDNADNVIKELKNDENVLYAGVDLIKIKRESFQTNPRSGEQWALNNIGQEVNGSVGRKTIDTNVIKTWADYPWKDTNQVIVAVLDDGMDVSHPDLKANILTNGYDYANNRSVYYYPNEDSGHATMIAGVIAACDNIEGIVGIAPKAKILPYKIMVSCAELSSVSWIIKAIKDAKLKGARIINMSFSLDYSDINLLKDEMNAQTDLIFVASAGNEGKDLNDVSSYPATWNLSNQINVGAIDNLGHMTSFSNYGDKVMVAAPGDHILTTKPNNSYGYTQGTSFAAPYVAGILALKINNYPSGTPAHYIGRIKESVIISACLDGKVSTGGRINAHAVLDATGNIRYGDLNGDGSVNSIDFAMERNVVMGTQTPTMKQLIAGDIDGNGVINSIDLSSVLTLASAFIFFPSRDCFSFSKLLNQYCRIFK